MNHKYDKLTNYVFNYPVSEINNWRIIIKESSWQVSKQDYEPAKPIPLCKHIHEKSMVISTGILELDRLLCPEITEDLILLPCEKLYSGIGESACEECSQLYLKSNTSQDNENKEKTDSWAGGIFIPRDKQSILSPVIVVEGSSGDGKTSLSLHIASNLARKGFICIYFSLELSPDNICQAIKGYGDFLDDTKEQKGSKSLKVINLEKPVDNSLNFNDGQIILPRISPLSFNYTPESSNQDFDRRYKDIRIALEWVDRLRQNTPLFCFIDSLSAFSNNAIKRESIQQLINLFREHQSPLLATVERQKHWHNQNEWDNYTTARYLADIEIKLESYFQKEDAYFRQTIEVAKTRYNRRLMGRHQMKLKSPRRTRTGVFDSRIGVVIYPSIDYQLSRFKKQQLKSDKKGYGTLIPNYTLPIGNFDHDTNDGEEFFHSNSSFVVSGPPGGHKFALAFNLLINQNCKICYEHKRDQIESALPGRKLIISLAEEGHIKLKDVAMHPRLAERYSPSEDINSSSTKIDNEKSSTIFEYNWRYKFDDDEFTISALNFRMGQMMPEQFLYILRNYINNINNNNDRIDGVLFDNTAHIRNRFPTIARNTLFLPTLVDMLKKLNCYSVFIDVRDTPDGNDHMTQSLLAAADCKLIVFRSGIGRTNKMIINNVRGKQYDNEIRTIEVKKGRLFPNELKITKQKRYAVSRLLGNFE